MVSGPGMSNEHISLSMNCSNLGILTLWILKSEVFACTLLNLEYTMEYRLPIALARKSKNGS